MMPCDRVNLPADNPGEDFNADCNAISDGGSTAGSCLRDLYIFLRLYLLQ